jgi:hypothetical protein
MTSDDALFRFRVLGNLNDPRSIRRVHEVVQPYLRMIDIVGPRRHRCDHLLVDPRWRLRGYSQRRIDPGYLVCVISENDSHRLSSRMAMTDEIGLLPASLRLRQCPLALGNPDHPAFRMGRVDESG